LLSLLMTSNVSTNSSSSGSEFSGLDSHVHLIVGGAVIGGVAVLILVGLFMCCRRIQIQSDEPHLVMRRGQRKEAYAAKVRGRETQAQLEIEREKKRRSGKRRGVVPEYDQTLEKSFASVGPNTSLPVAESDHDSESDAGFSPSQSRSKDGKSDREASSVLGELRSHTSGSETAALNSEDDVLESKSDALPVEQISAVHMDMLSAQALANEARNLRQTSQRWPGFTTLKPPPVSEASVAARGAQYLAAVDCLIAEEREREETHAENEWKAKQKDIMTYNSRLLLDREGQQILTGLATPRPDGATGRAIVPTTGSSRFEVVPVDSYLRRR